MATLKFNYGGTDYKLVAKDTKITTPSIKVGNLYIPCFKGNIGEEVTYGDKIYTLSPLKVGDYRSACSEKDAFDGYVYVDIRYRGALGEWGHVWYREFAGSIVRAYTRKSAFTVSISSNCKFDSGPFYIPFSYTTTMDFNYTVYHNSDIILQGHSHFDFTCDQFRAPWIDVTVTKQIAP